MKGLSFSEPMARAWMAGDKDVTRRLIRPQPPSPLYHLSRQMDSSTVLGRRKNGHFCWTLEDGPEIKDVEWVRQSYVEGEIVYIKETWAHFFNHQKTGKIFYKGTVPDFTAAEKKMGWRWRSPLLMPEWASRSKARIISVRPEQIQSITEEEAAREGMPHRYNTPYMGCEAINEFKKLWEIIHPGSWEKDSWVWRLEMEKIK